MKFSQIGDVLMGPRRSELILGMNVEVRVITFVSEEWGDSGGSVRSIVVCKFSHRKEFGPVVLLVVAEYTDVLFECLIDSFGLSVALRMVT